MWQGGVVTGAVSEALEFGGKMHLEYYNILLVFPQCRWSVGDQYGTCWNMAVPQSICTNEGITHRLQTKRWIPVLSSLEQITTTNRRAPLAVRPLEALALGHGDGTPPGTKVIALAQQPITELPLAHAGKQRALHDFTHTQHATNSCYPIGQAVRPPEALIGRKSCKCSTIQKQQLLEQIDGAAIPNDYEEKRVACFREEMPTTPHSALHASTVGKFWT
ncbi:hypothetical protein TNCV_5070941 [Trichonephila clavipes]|nr:hypothetical protein TNCV_5070941 [Trichonephila clavipes]